MNNEFGELYQTSKTEKMIDDFIADCEREAAKIEDTVDYYIAELVI